jgi:hypothetical protein
MDPERYINVRFDLDVEVSQITYYEKSRKQKCQLYFASAIHATIHIFHYIMAAAIQHVTNHSTSLNVWAELYDDNIALKYIQLSLLFINPKG